MNYIIENAEDLFDLTDKAAIFDYICEMEELREEIKENPELVIEQISNHIKDATNILVKEYAVCPNCCCDLEYDKHTDKFRCFACNTGFSVPSNEVEGNLRVFW